MKATGPAVVGLATGALASFFAIWKEWSTDHASTTQLAVLGWSALSLLYLGSTSIAVSRFNDRQEDKKRSPEELRGCLLVLHRAIAGRKGVSDAPEGWLRLTLHRVDGHELEQSVEYVGSEDRNKAGRRFSINAGLIGAVARTGQMRGFDRNAQMSFLDWCNYLVEKHGMTRPDAKATRDDRFSFLGVPIKSAGGKEVRAVLYLDAGQTAFFDKEVAGLVIHGCEGLAAWIDEQYYKK